MNRTALIGFTGFVGSNLASQMHFDALYNSANIESITGQDFDLLVCAGARAEKWKANREPERDLANIKVLIENLRHVSSTICILISTVDVYVSPENVYEDSPIETRNLCPYGLHRYMLEQFVREKFSRAIVIRLPGLFGNGLKKNFIFDMLKNPDSLNLTHSESKFQFYGLDRIWSDIQSVIHSGVSLVNFGTPPVSPREVAFKCFRTDFLNKTLNGPVFYDMRTRYANIFGRIGDYIRTEVEEFSEIEKFVSQAKALP